VNRKKVIIFISLIMATGIGVYILHEIDFIPHDDFEASLRKAIRDKKSRDFNLSEITPFQWDRLYILPPYSDTRSMQNIDHIDIENVDNIDADEGSCLLVFVRNGKVVYQLRYNRLYGDFAQLYREEGYSAEEARFRVPKRDEYWLKIELIKK